MFSDPKKSEQRYFVFGRKRKIISCNIDSFNKPICCKREVLQTFQTKLSTELLVSNDAICVDYTNKIRWIIIDYWCLREYK